MNKKVLLIVMAMCLALCCLAIVGTDTAYAQEDTKEGDKNLASKQGLGALESDPKSKKEDEGKGPNKVQMAVGVGSLFVMIAVMKWL